MSSDADYFVFGNRLASFQGPQPLSKRRPSTAASKKVTSWPHTSPAPEDLARAGFFFNPQPSNPDNVRCFLCHKDLDGWEEDDDPLREHLKHSSSCGWAICAAIELELGEVVNEDPRLPYLLDARKATFAGLWPYESKKGWKCKTKQLAEAGWKYTPTLESDDNTTCTYCQLALDGWESGDKPLDEHQRRSPNCPFFVLTRNPFKKQARGKAARPSKVSNSRLSVQSVQSVQSIQSVATITSDTQSLADPEESVLTTASATTAQGARKAATASTSRARKAAPGTTAKGRRTRTKKDEPIVIEDSILEEPVPAPAVGDTTSVLQHVEAPAEMEVAAPTLAPAKAPVKAPRGKKRTSEQAQATKPLRGKKRTSEEIEPAGSTETETAPAPKRRATRVGASSNPASVLPEPTSSNDYAMFNPAAPDVDEAAIEAELRALEQDMDVDRQMEDQLQNQNQQEQDIQVPKKGRKAAGTRKVSKQTTRKAKETVPATVEEVLQTDTERQPEPQLVPEVEMHEPEPAAAEAKTAKPKAKGRPKKASQQAQLPPPPPPEPIEDHEMGEDELHEESIISIASIASIASTSTAARESEQPIVAKQKAKAQPMTVTAVPVPVPLAAQAPPPGPAHAPQAAAEIAAEIAPAAAPPKRGRGRPSKKSLDSVRSSIGSTSQEASIASMGSVVPSKITPVPPPSIPAAALAAPEVLAPKAAAKAGAEGKSAKALPPLPKKRLSLRDIEEREMREQQAKEQAKEQALEEEARREEVLREEEALMEEQLQREQMEKEQLEKERLEKEQLEKEQRKKQAPKKQQPKRQTAQPALEQPQSRLPVAPATPRKLSPAASAKQAMISPAHSPQSSDAENQPPSSRPPSKGKTIAQLSHAPIPSFPAPPTALAAAQNANVTPVRESPSKRSINKGNTLGGLRGTLSWTAVDVDTIFELSNENNGERDILEGLLRKGTDLTTPEKAMSVEEFIFHNASQAERLLKEDCEAMVSQFEQQGSRAMRVLESLEVVE